MQTDPSYLSITGTHRRDLVVGGVNGEAIDGYLGDDELRGGGGNDQIIGSSGKDKLLGEAGDDTLIGGYSGDIGYEDNEADTMDGGAGADVYVVGVGDVASDSAQDWRYTSFITFSWEYTAIDTYWVLPGVDQTTQIKDADGGAQVFVLDAQQQQRLSATTDASVSLALSGTNLVTFLESGAGSIAVDERGTAVAQLNGGAIVQLFDFGWSDAGIRLDVGREGSAMVGTLGDDRLIGTSRNDLIVGQDGKDRIDGKSGNDEISGGHNDDVIDGGSGDDVLYGDRDNDVLKGGSGADRIWGGDQDDQLIGDSGDDVLSGGEGMDRMYGGSGNDRLLGGADTDRMTGDSGRDVFVFHAGDGADVITDFRGRNWGDRIEVSDDIVGFDDFLDIQAHASQFGSDTVIDFGNGDTLTLLGVRAADLQQVDFMFV